MKTVKVEGHTDLARDTSTGAIININTSEAELARQRKYNARVQRQEQQQLKSDVDQLKNDMKVIKDLLTQLVEK